MKAIKLKFTRPVHFGSERLDYGSSKEILHSDTLYSAVCQAWALSGHPEWIGEMSGNWGFALSSTFPFFGSGSETVYFFPRPFASLFGQHLHISPGIDRKSPKRIQWIDRDTFEKWRTKGQIPMEANKFKGIFYTDRPMSGSLWESEVYPRVKVGRNDGDEATPYYIEKLYFHRNAGLYFLAECDDESLKKLGVALDILSDEGLGTDRKVGHGQFEYEIVDFQFAGLGGADSMALSLLCPESAQWLESSRPPGYKKGYLLLKRGGWITTPPSQTFRKNPVYMFAEGSIFRTGQTIAGTVHNVLPESIAGERRPKHPVYRFGRAMLIPING